MSCRSRCPVAGRHCGAILRPKLPPGAKTFDVIDHVLVQHQIEYTNRAARCISQFASRTVARAGQWVRREQAIGQRQAVISATMNATLEEGSIPSRVCRTIGSAGRFDTILAAAEIRHVHVLSSSSRRVNSRSIRSAMTMSPTFPTRSMWPVPPRRCLAICMVSVDAPERLFCRPRAFAGARMIAALSIPRA